MDENESLPAKKNEKGPSLKKNLVFNLISQLVVLIIPLITTPYLARILREDGLGQISFSESTVVLFTLIANLGFNVYGLKQISKYRDDPVKRDTFFWSLMIVRFGFTCLALALFFPLLHFDVFGGTYHQLLLIFSMEIFACVFNADFFYQGIENFRSLAIRQMVLRVLGLVCIFVFVRTKDDLWIYALSLSLSTVFANLSLWPPLLKKIRFHKVTKRDLKEVFWPSLLLFVPTLCSTILTTVDRVMIGLIATNPDYENGCYVQAVKLINIFVILPASIQTIVFPRSVKDKEMGDEKEFQRHLTIAVRFVLFFGFPLMFGVIALAPRMCAWYLGDGYEKTPIVLSILSGKLILATLSGLFNQCVFFAMNKDRIPVIATVIASIFNLVLNYAFILLWGGIGAAIATLSSELLEFIIIVAIIWKKNYLPKTIFLEGWRAFIGSAAMFVVLFFVRDYFPAGLPGLLLLFLIGFSIFFAFVIATRDPMIKMGVLQFKKVLSKFKKETSSQ